MRKLTSEIMLAVKFLVSRMLAQVSLSWLAELQSSC